MTEPAFITWADDRDMDKAMSQATANLNDYGAITSNASHRSFLDIETNRSVRPGFSRHDYDAFRPGDRVPVKDKAAIQACMKAYESVGIIKNVIDLMGDFASQGITLSHPNESVERFYKEWWARIKGSERSERFLNTLYRCGNVIVRRHEAKISRVLKSEMSKADMIKVDSLKIKKGTIGWGYEILNPLLVDVDGDHAAKFLGKLNYRMKISKTVKNSISVFDSSSPFMTKDTVPLPLEEIAVYHYKKDDWDLWARPMIYAILDDVFMMEKMKLADMAALDGAISNIRLWTVGSLEHKILPTKATLDRIRDLLASNVGGGTMDFIWGPELSFTESNSQVYKYLGSEKYSTTLSSIYAGLGVPPTLTGMAGQSGGFTNNFISLKTLVERLEYGRDLLTHFWNGEIKRVQLAMGFGQPATVQFSTMNLSDDVAEKNLLIQLADRDVISHKTLQERVGENTVIEGARLRKEAKDRQANKLPPKASPYHNPQLDKQQEHDTEKTKLIKEFEPVGRPEDGRPKNSKDKQPRKKRVDTPKNKPGVASLSLWTNNAQKTIADIVTPSLLAHYGKKNLRSLTKTESAELEDIKFGVLANLEPMSQLDEDSVLAALSSGACVGQELRDVVSDFTSEFLEENGRNPSMDELRHIQALAYVFSE